MPLGKRHAHRGRQPLPQRPGGGFHPRQFEIIRMPGTRTAELPEAADFIDRQMRITREMQRRIDEHRTVARRQDESVAVGPGDRKRAVEGKSVSVRVDLGGRRIITKKNKYPNTTTTMN